MPAPVIRSRLEVPSLDVPGPGMYHQNTKWKGNAISWRRPTIALRDEPPILSHLDIKYPPAKAMGMAFRLNPASKELIPGPGAYELDGFSLSRRQRTPGGGGPSVRSVGTFGSGRSPRRDTEQVPGPGAYLGTELSASRRGPSGAALRFRLREATDDVPGPGAYDHKDIIGTGLAASFKGSRKDSKRASTPGPGTYDLATTIGSNA